MFPNLIFSNLLTENDIEVLKFTAEKQNWNLCSETTYNVEGFGATDLRTPCVTYVMFLENTSLTFSVGLKKASTNFTEVSTWS
jgi:hypothetical protein